MPAIGKSPKSENQGKRANPDVSTAAAISVVAVWRSTRVRPRSARGSSSASTLSSITALKPRRITWSNELGINV